MAAKQIHAAAKLPASHASKPFFESQPARATNFFASTPAIQTKLTVGEAGDRFEREADSVADAVVQRKASRADGGTATPSVQAKCAKCEHEDTVQRQADGAGSDSGAHVANSVQQGLAAQRGAGQSLDASLRQEMEQGIGADFSGVRIHSGAESARLNQELSARAFTHGSDIYFNAGEFQPHSRTGQHLLAHELTHVVQQSPSTDSVPSVQRDGPKPGSPPDKVQIAKDELKAKFELKDISEQNGVAWTESQLRKLAGLFAKMSKPEQERLQGVTLMLTDKFPSKTLKGKPFTISGKTYGTSLVELTPAGVSGTVLHESGHLIHNKAVENAEKLFERSQIKADLETARNFLTASSKRRFTVPADQPQIGEQIKAVIDAASTFERSGDDDRKANRDALLDAEANLPVIKPEGASKDLSVHLGKVGAFTAALLRWSDEREKAVGPYKKLDEFVGIVKKDKLARRSAIFTSYAEANWPDKPWEFFSEAYQLWVTNPAAVKEISGDLAAWFKKGGHLGPKIPPDRPPVKIPMPTKIPAMQNAPVLEELLLEAGQSFLPVIEGGLNIVDVAAPQLLPKSLPRDTK